MPSDGNTIKNKPPDEVCTQWRYKIDILLVLSFEWYRKIKRKQYDKLYAKSPNGYEMAHKYNKVNPKKKMNGNWLTCYVSEKNTNVKQVSL